MVYEEVSNSGERRRNTKSDRLERIQWCPLGKGVCAATQETYPPDTRKTDIPTSQRPRCRYNMYPGYNIATYSIIVRVK
jgi:hypothetical protein